MAAVVRFCRFNCFFDAGERKVKGECIFLNSRETKLCQGAYLPEEQSFGREPIYRKKQSFGRELIYRKKQSFVKELIYRKKQSFDRKLIHQKKRLLRKTEQ